MKERPFCVCGNYVPDDDFTKCKYCRDDFAKAALTGAVANSNRDGSWRDFAVDAYAFADAMMAERSKP